ncbi:uncharacterized protein TNCV_1992971 [Trichonephila clavipes]|nr:uncharacterized protein TNCV_1992971 [Trichonephila clavipes]
MFKEGRENVEDKPRAGHSSTSRTAENEQRVQRLLNTDRRLSVRMIAEQLGIDKMFLNKITSEDLGQTANVCPFLLRGIPSTWKCSDISANWKFHHDNAPSHTCFVVTEHLTKNGIVTIPQPFYSPDLDPADFSLFPKVKTALKGRHHGTLDNVKRACTQALKDVSVGDFQGAYEAWKRHLQKCVHAQGAYFEYY